jgi:DNA-binding response OmpR family regulator
MSFKILVVEDNPDHRDLIVMMLKMEGYTTLTAKDGSEGLEHLQADCPDLIICDVMMPRLDGIEMVKALRKLSACSATPVLMITAHGDARGDAMSAGADRTMGKPFDFDELIRIVRDMLPQSDGR